MRSLFAKSLLSALTCVAAHSMALAADEPEDPTKNDYRLAAALQNRLLFRFAIPRWERVIAGSPDKVRIEKARYTQHYLMLQRNLLYTAVTRGKKLVVLVGTKKALAMAVHRADTGQPRWNLAHSVIPNSSLMNSTGEIRSPPPTT